MSFNNLKKKKKTYLALYLSIASGPDVSFPKLASLPIASSQARLPSLKIPYSVHLVHRTQMKYLNL